MNMLSKQEFTKRLAKKLQEARRKKDISQEELAEQADLYRTYVGHVENSRYNLTAYVLYKFIKALDIDPRELFDL